MVLLCHRIGYARRPFPLSARWIEMMLTRRRPDGGYENENRQRTHCQCAESMSLGIGVCHAPGGGEAVLNMCEAEEYYLWGSTYGSRALGRDVSPSVVDPGGGGGARANLTGIACGTNVSLSSAKFLNSAGEGVRLAQRQHNYAHKQARLLRAFLPRPA